MLKTTCKIHKDDSINLWNIDNLKYCMILQWTEFVGNCTIYYHPSTCRTKICINILKPISILKLFYVFLLLIVEVGIEPRGFALSNIPSPCYFHCEKRSLWIPPGKDSLHPPTSASQSAGIIGMDHYTYLEASF